MSTDRFRGCRRDTHDSRDKMAALRPAGIALPAESTLWLRVPRHKNQGRTSSCVGHGVVSALELYRVLCGRASPDLSAFHLYLNARLRGMLPGEQLEDGGAMVRDGMLAACNLGVCLARDWPVDVNVRPGAELDVEGEVYADAPVERIAGTGNTLRDNILHALVSGPVPHGKSITRAYMDHHGDGVLAAPGPGEDYIGGHCTYWAGYRNNGAEVFEIGSWVEPGSPISEHDWGFAWTNAHGALVRCGGWVSSEWILSPGFGDAWRFRPPS